MMNNQQSLISNQCGSSIVRVLIALFLIALPITSFPYLPKVLGGGAQVRPLSIYPLLILLPLLTLPRLWHEHWHNNFHPLAVFALIAAAASTVSLLDGFATVRDVALGERTFRALLTLGLGAAMYFTISLFPQGRADLRFALRMLYIGLMLALLWGSLQAVYILRFDREWFEFLSRIQKFISTRKLFETRISGLTFEPNWFAGQLVFLYLPWLLAAVVTGWSAFRWRWRALTIEMLLTLWLVTVLLLTFSRLGLLVLLPLCAAAALLWGIRRAQRARKIHWGRLIVQSAAIALGLLILLGVVGSQNNYFSRLWRYFQEDSNQSYLDYIAVGQRVVYWETAYRMFEAHPLLGVGPGNYAFYFAEFVPLRSWHTQPEMLRQLTPEGSRNNLNTAKNLYARLLAETGLLGFGAFLTFILAVTGSALQLARSSRPQARFWGIGGLFGVLAFLLAAFSFDSFALPNLWIVFGLITAAHAVLQPPLTYPPTFHARPSNQPARARPQPLTHHRRTLGAGLQCPRCAHWLTAACSPIVQPLTASRSGRSPARRLPPRIE